MHLCSHALVFLCTGVLVHLCSRALVFSCSHAPELPNLFWPVRSSDEQVSLPYSSPEISITAGQLSKYFLIIVIDIGPSFLFSFSFFLNET